MYSCTVDGFDVFAVTVITFEPVSPGTRSSTSKRAVPWSSSVSSTTPAFQEFAAFSVVAENAAYDVVPTMTPLAMTARGRAIQAARRPWSRRRCMSVPFRGGNVTYTE